MKRAERLDLVQRVTQKAERDRAESLGTAEHHLAACEAKLLELQTYRAEYERRLRDSGGARDIVALRDYQVFLARLSEAIEQAAALVAHARVKRDAERLRWQEAAQRSRAIETLADRWQIEERRADDRREQRDTDERAQRRTDERGMTDVEGSR